MNSKQIVTFVGAVLVFTGLLGSLSTENTPVQQLFVDGEQSSLEVKKGTNLPTSTIDYLQGPGNLQGQAQHPQGANAGSQLQPNAGKASLPDNY